MDGWDAQAFRCLRCGGHGGRRDLASCLSSSPSSLYLFKAFLASFPNYEQSPVGPSIAISAQPRAVREEIVYFRALFLSSSLSLLLLWYHQIKKVWVVTSELHFKNFIPPQTGASGYIYINNMTWNTIPSTQSNISPSLLLLFALDGAATSLFSNRRREKEISNKTGEMMKESKRKKRA